MRIIIAAVLGGIVLLIWGFLYWGIYGFQVRELDRMSNPDAVTMALKQNITEPGVYWYPVPEVVGADTSVEDLERMTEAFNERHEAGPLYHITYRPDGFAPTSMTPILRALGMYALTALVASLMLSVGPRNQAYLMRVIYITGFGVLMAFGVHLIGWNFMHLPMDEAVFRIIDSVVGWLLAGLVIGAVLGPKRAKA